MAAPPAGTIPTRPIPIPSAFSTWSAMPWRSCSRSATTRSAVARAWVSGPGSREVAGVVGQEAGSPVGPWSALTRPAIFRSMVLMSSPSAGAPGLPFNTANGASPPRRAMTDDELDAELAALPRPRKYYRNYQRTRGANEDMMHAPQGLHAVFTTCLHDK